MPNQPYNMKVSIEELSFDAIIGILPNERETAQKVMVSMEFEYLFYRYNDEFIDYSKVAKYVKKKIQKKEFKLIEDAVVYLERKLYGKYNITSLHIKITKPDILEDCKVSVENVFLDQI